jgi:hypothetical protein
MIPPGGIQGMIGSWRGWLGVYEFTMAKVSLCPYLQNIKQSDDMPNPESRGSRRETFKAREAIRRRKKYFHDHKLRFFWFFFLAIKVAR